MSLHRQVLLLVFSIVLLIFAGAAMGADLLLVALVGVVAVAASLEGIMVSSSPPPHELR